MKQGWQEALRIHCQVLWVLGCDLRNEQLLAALKCQGAARAPGSTGLWCGLLPAQQGPLPGPQDTSGESQPGQHCGCVTQGWGHGCEWTLLPAQSGDGAGRASLQHSPAGARAWPRHRVAKRDRARLPRDLGILGHSAGSDQNYCWFHSVDVNNPSHSCVPLL